jgi:hypothetical protein
VGTDIQEETAGYVFKGTGNYGNRVPDHTASLLKKPHTKKRTITKHSNMTVEFMIMWIMTTSTLMMEVSLQRQPIHTRLQGVTSLIQE